MSRPIAIDARLNAYRQGGIPRSTAALIEQLVKRYPQEDWLILGHRKQREWPLAGPQLHYKRLWTPPHHRAEQLTLPIELLKHRPRLLHSPDFIPPLHRTYPAIITVHDLAFKHFPEILDDAAKRYYGQIEAAVQSAEGIIAVSQSTANDITDLLGVASERIRVIHHGVSQATDSVAAGEQRTIRGIKLTAGSFIVFISTFEPRKNIPMILQALKQAHQRKPNSNYKLILAGTRGWLDQPIFDSIDTLKLHEHVTILERPTDNDVQWLLSACRIYVNPSKYEGFGLPALEALAHGAPSIVADASSLPEVVGTAAILIDPYDIDGWSNAIEDLWENKEQQQQLRLAGKERASAFNWSATAQQTYQLYQDILATT